jgi:cbb3-type cytochrome c oxidase subunit III
MPDDKRPERETRILPAVVAAGIALAIAAGAVAYAAGHYGERTKTVTVQGAGPTTTAGPATTVSPAVAAGAHTFVQFACSQCHGPQGSGGVDPAVPALTTVGKTLTVAQLTHIIDHGLGESANPKVPYMPVWGEVLSKTQVANLVAYIRAGLPSVADTQPVSVPTGQGAAVAGAALYLRYGCVNCHGPNGLGGVPNPLSPDKTIPSLSGGDFRGEFNTDAKIAAVIRSGSVIGRAPIVSMPHWGGILSDQQIAQLIAYLKTLK